MLVAGVNGWRRLEVLITNEVKTRLGLPVYFKLRATSNTYTSILEFEALNLFICLVRKKTSELVSEVAPMSKYYSYSTDIWLST